MRAPVSACIVTRGEPTLQRAIDSVRAHVAEVCVVLTDDQRFLSESECRGADKLSYWTKCNDEHGEIVDFSSARNFSFALASEPWALWLDSDDVVCGLDGEDLAKQLAAAEERFPGQPVRLLAPYEYGHDKVGRCNVLQVRERVVGPGVDRFEWIRPVHEACAAKDRASMVDLPLRGPVWVHSRRDHVSSSRRNLRILRAFVAKNPSALDDPRVLYDLGQECALNGQDDEALKHLAKYVEASGWAEERALACRRAADVAWRRSWTKAIAESGDIMAADVSEAERWALRALSDWPSFDSFLAVAKLAYYQIGRLPEEERGAGARFVVETIRRGLASPEMGVHPRSPADRGYGAHVILHDCLWQLGDGEGALEAVDVCLEARPGDQSLLVVRAGYERAVEAMRAGRKTGDPHVLPPSRIEGGERRLDVVVACEKTFEEWDAETVREKGAGGSETAVVEVARRLAAKGHRVRVYASVPKEGVHDGVEYRYPRPPDDACDVLVAWRGASLWRWQPARARVLWVHDVEAVGMTLENELRFDRIFALSRWHKAHLVQAHGLHPNHVHVTRNGVDLARFDQEVERAPHRAVYSSSADRGLGLLLDMWPLIRARVPDAELHVYYGMELWKAVARNSNVGAVNRGIAQLEGRLASYEALGVRAHGRVNGMELARGMLSAGAWLYPQWFAETYCIGAAEAQAAGLAIVTSPLAAINETVGPRGRLVAGEWASPDYQRNFVDAAVEALTMTDDFTREGLRFYARQHFSWDGVVDDWERLFATLLEESRHGYLPPYQPMARAA